MTNPPPDQPDGIDDDSFNLPSPAKAAERVAAYVRHTGDGLYDVTDGAPLYGRDLAALTCAVQHGHSSDGVSACRHDRQHAQTALERALEAEAELVVLRTALAAHDPAAATVRVDRAAVLSELTCLIDECDVDDPARTVLADAITLLNARTATTVPDEADLARWLWARRRPDDSAVPADPTVREQIQADARALLAHLGQQPTVQQVRDDQREFDLGMHRAYRPEVVAEVAVCLDEECDWDAIATWCGGSIGNTPTPAGEYDSFIHIPDVGDAFTRAWIVQRHDGTFAIRTEVEHPSRQSIATIRAQALRDAAAHFTGSGVLTTAEQEEFTAWLNARAAREATLQDDSTKVLA